MKNKKIVVIGGGILLLILLLVIIIIFFIKSNDNKTNGSVTIVGKAIKEVQELNEILSVKNLNMDSKITLENGLDCYELIYDDFASVASNFSKLYYNVISQNGGIVLLSSGEYNSKVIDKPTMFVCLKESCEFKKIDDYEVVSEKEDEITIGVNTQNVPVSAYTYKRYEDGQWKFNKPIIDCEKKK